jgi:2-polyprenyl-3-methyl-5-hydroxy-6-metoxy-1,4-benzoquinol methylase
MSAEQNERGGQRAVAEAQQDSADRSDLGGSCRICDRPSEPVGVVFGRYSNRDYHLRRCPSCHFAFIVDPWQRSDRAYDEQYYDGKGADRLVDYRFELDRPDRTIRRYEWAGISRLVEGLVGRRDGLRWLDFGCGGGGLVRYLNSHTGVQACGFDEGAIVAAARQRGTPILSAQELSEQQGRFDVVTAVEVVEHALEPLATMREIRRLLRPGGLFFLTTGNAQPFAGDLTRWSYVIPEIHVSYFEPRTLEIAMRKTGFRPEPGPRGPAFDQILKFKVLKNLRIRKRNPLTDALPAGLIGSIAERTRHLGDQPVGWAE